MNDLDLTLVKYALQDYLMSKEWSLAHFHAISTTLQQVENLIETSK